MQKDKIIAALSECFVKAFPQRKLPNYSDTFSSLGITSLELAYLMYHVEKKFNLDLLDLNFHEADSLAGYLERIENALKK